MKTLSPSGLEGLSPPNASGYASPMMSSNCDRTADSSYLAAILRREENVPKSGTLFRSGKLQIDVVNGITHRRKQYGAPWEIYNLEKCGKIHGRIRGGDARTTVW